MKNSENTTSVGFKGFRPAENIGEAELESAVARLTARGEFFVFPTGGKYAGRAASLRSNALKTLDEDAGKLVPLADFLRRAGRALGKTKGYDPATVKGGLSLHSVAKPSVYLYLRKTDAGNYVAVNRIPTPDPRLFPGVSFEAGDVVIPADAVRGSTVTLGDKPKAKATTKRRTSAKAKSA